jgi:hypothetical protein
MSEKPKKGDLRVWWVPQVPGESFKVQVKSIEEGKRLCEILADYDRFQLEHNIKPDYSNAGGIQRYDGEFIDEKDDGWSDIDEDEEENDERRAPGRRAARRRKAG